MKSLSEQLYEAVQSALKTTYLDIINESPNHHVPSGAETHFKIIAVSSEFQGLSLVARHQKIYGLERIKRAMDEEGLHALSLVTLTPEEWDKKQGKVTASPACRGGQK